MPHSSGRSHVCGEMFCIDISLNNHETLFDETTLWYLWTSSRKKILNFQIFKTCIKTLDAKLDSFHPIVNA